MNVDYDEDTDEIVFTMGPEGTEVEHRESPEQAQTTARRLVRKLQFARQLDPQEEYDL